MSVKQLRQLGGQELARDENSSSDGEPEVLAPTKKVNRFALLEDSNDSEEKQEQSSEEIKSEQPQKIGGKSKKKKKNKKKKASEKADDDWEEIAAASVVEEDVDVLLKVTGTDLDCFAEQKRLLGPGFRPPSPEERTRRQVRKKFVPQFGIVRKQIIDKANLGLTVCVDEDKKVDGYSYYRFCHDAKYQVRQQLVWDLITHDPTGELELNDILKQNLDAIILSAENCIQGDDQRNARLFAEFGLSLAQSVMPSDMWVLSPKIRFDYGWRENRAFFILLFHHIQGVIQRRCFLTALNLVKFMFAKDPEDPLGALLWVDSLALRAGQFQFLIDFHQRYKKAYSFDQLPNMLYSIAFAYHSLALEKDDDGLNIVAENLLFDAVTRFPSVLHAVCEKMHVRPTKDVVDCLELEDYKMESDPPGIKTLTKIYVHHTFEDVWMKNNLMGWIETATERMVKERKGAVNKAIREARNKNKKLFVGMADPVARHGFLLGCYPCEEGCPALDPFPPKTGSRSGYERQNVAMEAVESNPVHEEWRTMGFRNMINGILASLNPHYQLNDQEMANMQIRFENHLNVGDHEDPNRVLLEDEFEEFEDNQPGPAPRDEGNDNH